MRAETNRSRIVRAVVDLVGNGNLSPTAETVAAEAGVSLRTVFRHFEDMENLYLEISAALFDRAQPVIDRPFPQLPWPDLLEVVLDRRIEVFEMIAPYKRALDIFRHRSPALAEAHQRVSEVSRSVLAQRVPAEVLARPHMLDLLDLLLSPEAWQRLRESQRQSVAEARATLRAAIAAIVRAD
jgi:AcrR family transcriptional regulator